MRKIKVSKFERFLILYIVPKVSHKVAKFQLPSMILSWDNGGWKIRFYFNKIQLAAENCSMNVYNKIPRKWNIFKNCHTMTAPHVKFHPLSSDFSAPSNAMNMGNFLLLPLCLGIDRGGFTKNKRGSWIRLIKGFQSICIKPWLARNFFFDHVLHPLPLKLPDH